MVPKHPHPPHHHHPEIFVGSESERSLKAIGEILQQVGSILIEKGNITLNDLQVVPSDPCCFIARYERSPHDELVLKFEIKWDDESPTARVSSKKGVLKIE